MRLRAAQWTLFIGTVSLFFAHSALADDQTATNYNIPADVLDSGGADVSKSNSYTLSDSIGEPVIGYSSTNNYVLNSGYRQPSAADYISVSCTDIVNLGNVVGTGLRTGTGTCTVYTDAYDGYRMIWTAGSNLNRGLIAHWKLDETSGTTAYDSSGNGYNGTLTSGPVIGTDVPTKYFSTRSVNFDGIDDKIISSADIPMTGDFEATLSIWVKFNSVSSGYKAVIDFGSNGTREGFAIFQGVGANGVAAVGFYGSQNCTTAAGTLTTGQWYHLVATKEPGAISTSNTKLYINGVSQALTCGATGVPNMVSGKLYVGSDVANEVSNSMVADEARVYDRALSAEEVRDLASLAPPGSLTASGSQTAYIPGIFFPFTGGLVGHWKLDEFTAGSTVTDSSGYNKDGTAVGAGGGNNLPQPNNSVPVNSNAQSLRSLDFDGTDDYVDVGHIAPPAITVAGWVRLDTTAARFTLLSNALATGTSSGYRLWFDGTSSLIFDVSNGTSGIRASASVALETGRWYHWAGTYNSTDGSTLYLDGISVDTAAADGTIGDPGKSTLIGARNFTSVDNFSNGQIDDVRIYDAALTSAQIKALAGVPQTWSVAATESAWGGRLSSFSTDTDSKWGTDGSSESWLNIGEGSYPLVRRATATPLAGSTQFVEFRGEVGSSAVQEAGIYTGVASFTIVGY